MTGGPVVDTAHGRLRGSRRDGVDVYLGVPYAARPVGPRRFRPPEPPSARRRERDATTPGPVCPQPQPAPARGAVQDEDCLHVNVWTPGVAGTHPVLVYLPGGGFVAGDASSRVTDGARLAARGVVVVAVSYRLHAFGFLDLGGAHDPNVGILDQVAALRWVRDNIDAFGGDPGNVTVAGYSAGGNSVATLLAVPEARGLFRRAVVQDGSAVLSLSRSTTGAVACEVLAVLGIDDPSDRAALERVPAADIVTVAAEVGTRYAGVLPGSLPVSPETDRRKGLTWTPALGKSLPQRPLDAVGAGAAAGIDLLVGTNRDSMTMISDRVPDVDRALLAAHLSDHLGDHRTVEDVIGVYAEDLGTASPRDVLGALLTDLLLAVPTVQLAEGQLQHHPGVWLYEYAEPGPTGRAGHSLDTGLWFDNVARSGGERMRRLAARMADALVAFVSTGDPSGAGLPAWTPYSSEDRATMVLAGDSEIVNDPHPGRRRLWAAASLP